jgi:hypothetical protein
MKKTIGLIFAALLLIAGFSVDSLAQRYYGNRSIDSRQRRQQTRIYSGVRRGSLTRAELYRLQRQQYRIYRTESRYRRSGGGLSWRERYYLQRRLNRSSRNIYRQKRDRQNYRAYRYYPRRRL